jgi:hypothetical protein
MDVPKSISNHSLMILNTIIDKNYQYVNQILFVDVMFVTCTTLLVLLLLLLIYSMIMLRACSAGQSQNQVFIYFVSSM